jgi:hypothetical protein
MSCPPLSSMSQAVEHRRQARRKPDASLYCGYGDSGASGQHAPCGRDSCADSACQIRADARAARLRSSHRCNRSGRDRMGGKQSPAPDSAGRQRGGLWPASAVPVNAETASTEHGVPCHTGAAPSPHACRARYRNGLGGYDRYRACFFGGKFKAALLPHSHPRTNPISPTAFETAIIPPF